ncbi:MAG: tRNA threonylcarbamoyladenosine dehydratase [Rhizobacter sp.]|nr:tRNA threonylcarbamoyladenosine dehydratase [Rhizobacter sp.]
MLALATDLLEADAERRFGGLRRLYGNASYERIRSARIAIVGLGGVGSWAAEALARSGVAALTLIDFDNVSESNINRQVQATSHTVGQAKVLALQERIALIHPECLVTMVEEFVDETNWPGLLPHEVDAVIDACDQVKAKAALAAWAIATDTPLVCSGAAGGKRKPQAVEVEDLSATTHDPLLATLRQRLRQKHGGARSGPMGVRCVFSREAVVEPEALDGQECEVDGSLNCHGYGSSVAVTSTFGMTCAAETLELIFRHKRA